MSRIDVESGVAVAEIGDPAVAVCAVCPHPVESHDMIARRFCTATQAGTSDRGCVCAGEPKKAATSAMRVRK
ncbi:RGCVC family protein [Amycolatopsis sp. NPDC051045]|uniref:RGCVC family protein n=1 Tax=Amycolatopsis sp. NPDC051045 TaxID=3156922 RepID=UPI003427D1B0